MIASVVLFTYNLFSESVGGGFDPAAVPFKGLRHHFIGPISLGSLGSDLPRPAERAPTPKIKTRLFAQRKQNLQICLALDMRERLRILDA
jgi:hypothetical protein